MTNEMDDGIISFKWNNHSSTFFNVLSTLRIKETYTDATLACEGKFYPIHKLVLSTCSDYFFEVFERVKCRSPVVILKDIRPDDLEALLDYMYHGEVDVRQSELSNLLEAAECLQVKGLAVADDEYKFTPKRVLSPSYDCKSPCSTPLKSPTSPPNDDNSLITPSKKILYSHENQFSPAAKRIKIEREDDRSSEKRKERKCTKTSSNDISKSLNAVEVPLQFQNTAFKSRISPKSFPSSESLTSPISLTKSKTIQRETDISSKCSFSLQDNKSMTNKRLLRIKSKPIKIVRPSNRDKSGVRLQISSNSRTPNQKFYYVNHEDHNGVNKIAGTRSINAETFSDDIMDDSFVVASDNISNEKIGQPSTSKKSQKVIKNIQKKEETAEIITEYCNKIGLPNFLPIITPYLKGHDLDKKTKSSYSKIMTGQLFDHFQNHNMVEVLHNFSMRTAFYALIQLKIMEKYPHIIQEESKRKRGQKGPLAYLMNRLVEKVNTFLKVKQEMTQYAGEGTKHLSSSDIKDEVDDEIESFEESIEVDSTLEIGSSERDIKMEGETSPVSHEV